MNISKKNRIVYLDFCKFLAIFIVTWGHCSQVVSGTVWNNFWGGTQIGIAFHMPLFFVISGWFINPEKIKKQTIREFLFVKFKRLMIPALIWYLIGCLISLNIPSIVDALSYYWFLTCMFLCFIIIAFCIKYLRFNLFWIGFVSSIVVLLCPYSNFLNINFMYPMLWTGLLLKKLYENHDNSSILLVSLIISFILVFFWDKNYSVYLSPFNICNFDFRSLLIYFYRFSIGISLSIFIISIAYKCEKSSFITFTSSLGKYTLIIYTFSFLFNRILNFIYSAFHLHTNKFFIVDIYSFMWCLLLIILSIFLYKIFAKNRISRILLLGE